MVSAATDDACAPPPAARLALLRPGSAVRLLRAGAAGAAAQGALFAHRDRVDVAARVAVGAQVLVGAGRRSALVAAARPAAHVDPRDAARGHDRARRAGDRAA